MRINSTEASSPTDLTKNNNLPAASGKTFCNKLVTTAEVSKQMPGGADTQGPRDETKSLADRKAALEKEIATADDFQPAIGQLNTFSEIKRLICSTPAFNDTGIQKSDNGEKSGKIVGKCSELLQSAINSIKYAGGERFIAPGYYSLPSRDMTPVGLGTPHGAKFHLEALFDNIKEMQVLNAQLQAHSIVDIALTLTAPENRQRLQPHVEAVFAAKENR